MAILTSYTLVPELQHWFHSFVVNSELNKDLVPPPTDIASTYMPENSFIEMLFNDDYSQSTYEYRYIDETNIGCIPRSVLRRIQIYPGSWNYVTIDAAGDNIFNLQTEDLTMLDALLAYRNGATDSSSFIFIDSTAITFVADSTADLYILSANYSSLPTTLSKLIYLYLRLEVLEEFILYNTDSLVSNGELLETCFESYLLDKYFTFMSNRNPDLIYDCQCDN